MRFLCVAVVCLILLFSCDAAFANHGLAVHYPQYYAPAHVYVPQAPYYHAFSPAHVYAPPRAMHIPRRYRMFAPRFNGWGYRRYGGYGGVGVNVFGHHGSVYWSGGGVHW